MDREAQPALPFVEFYFRVIRFEQIFQPVLPCGPRAVIGGPLIGQLESVEVEAEREFAKSFEAKINDCPICRHRKRFFLATEIAAGPAMSPKNGAVSFQHCEARIAALCDQKTACWQGYEGKRSVISFGALCRYCAPCSATGLVPSQYWRVPSRKERLSIRGPGDERKRSIMQTIDVRSW